MVRRAQRLFQILQILRRGHGPHTADDLAREVETSRRTIYRDIAVLMAERVPIRGEAGVGYVLEGGFDLPPLMLNVDEVEALVLGVQWVGAHADPRLAAAADHLRDKIILAVPEPLRRIMRDPAVGLAAATTEIADTVDVLRLRNAIHTGHKLRIGYVDTYGVMTERTVWPFSVGYFDDARLLCAWCELRGDFRHFRTDRISHAETLSERSPEQPRALKARWNAMQVANDLPVGL